MRPPTAKIADGLIVNPVSTVRFAAINGVRCHRSRTDPHFVSLLAEVIGDRCFGCRSASAAIRGIDFNRVNLANRTLPNELAAEPAVLLAALLGAVLKNGVVFCENFFASNVLSNG
jgi:hypothetical protein